MVDAGLARASCRVVHDSSTTSGAICNWIWVGERAGPAVAPPFYASVYGFLGHDRRECGALIDGD
jgi:hypothetical protein